MGQSSHGLRETLRLVSPYVEGNRRALALIVTTATIGGFAEALMLVIVARLSFALASGQGDVAVHAGPLGLVTMAVPTLVAIALGLLALRVVLQFSQAWLSARTTARVNRNIRVRLVRSYLAASWALQSGERSGRLQEMLGGYAAAASGTVATVATGLVAFVSLLTFLVTALAVSALAAVGVALAALALSLVLRPVRSATRRASGRAAGANLGVATDVAELAGHALEVRIFGAERSVAGKLSEDIGTSARLNARTGFLGSLAPIVYQGSAMLFLVGAIAVLYAADVSRLGAVGGVVLIMMRSLSFGQSLQSSYQSLHQAAPPLEVLRDELDRYEAARVTRSGDPVEHIGELGLDHVSFEYEPDVPVLRDLSFRIPHGEIVGIVGPSGAGKSTLVQLILRLREPTEGRLLVDGHDVTPLALDDWYQRVSFVPQDPALFAGSIADNIRFHRDDVDEAALERAAKLANLHDEVMAWPRGYATPVGERGGQLSGGQRQRLCIARALVEEPDVIVFDEPTSSLDVKSEALVREAIAGLSPHATVFVIAHRMSTLTICHRVMVLLDGELHGFDEPERLEASNPFYREALELSGLR